MDMCPPSMCESNIVSLNCMVMKKLTYSRKFGTKSLDPKNEVKVR